MKNSNKKYLLSEGKLSESEYQRFLNEHKQRLNLLNVDPLIIIQIIDIPFLQGSILTEATKINNIIKYEQLQGEDFEKMSSVTSKALLDYLYDIPIITGERHIWKNKMVQ